MMTPTEDQIGSYIAASGKAAWEVPGLPADTPLRPIKTVGIIGAGTMGGGIAMNFATAGFQVRIVETTQEALDRGLAVVRGNYQRSSDKGRFPQDEVEARMARFDGRLAIADLADCDLIIEAVFENMELKRKIFTELDAVMKPGAILATNTSALDINEIAGMTKRPEDVIGLHFFSPANVMKLLEIVRAKHTADDVVATCMALAKDINKIATLVGVCPGFVGNRILFARQIQANKLVYQGVMPWDVDAALNQFGFKMGPFQMSDLAGLDIGWSKGAKTDNPIRDALCELDRRGQKTKAGFYDYDENRRPVPSDVTAGIIREITGAEPSKMSADEIIEICIYPMINEAVKILEENKAQRPSDVDVVWLNGYGWPADKGGPMFYGDMVGAQAVLNRMETLGAEDAAFAPAETLRKLAAEGGKFTEVDTGGLKV
ncbi:3-hydroxyacyl-CoA dehydrogenase [Sulfitobacter mediterraneus]|uniref:3-hydroxyacyl-CoA dehydrogenase n=3 Tax=Sulfitobacter mediterraneus TaxID=83219 RepID=A0A061SLN8_9RHOB|nr:3-hydroxyacyl-CoA dehydrogenase [Sulfitobacter mediterraneus]KAJ01767.1 3-hydroxyacyl-CoA dehydrogenase [Sulfitobacter mediterraneus]MBM1558651.1 3-hydroxyacyl-CoA dehydrogenase [Sulfitobacter mediterraneus]MBM1569967.1 3-hydroxyacyl-CoA dehydrogenase [Sulfitobacter mediterraneus]MBM1573971.1 3-hydroxyacyl-CoA dehydrogenase [Sulfitobacter mediterraneus]MBM1577745.1 3-hydroxyacyl-CoA dehydrogenase [Sulfitobacter mediterraneus]